jgi:KaiC/GvpD/RAD55 family RecA-like ATPase
MQLANHVESPFLGKRAFTLNELSAMGLKKPKPVVDGMLNEGETALLVARPKTGKTRLAQQLSVALASGSDFLGMSIAGVHRVLYIDLESQPEDIIGHFQAIAGSAWEQVKSSISVYAVQSLAESSVGLDDVGLGKLIALIDKANADFLVIDNWRLVANGQENDAGDVVQSLRALSRLRSAYPKLTVLILHHLRKDGKEERYKSSLRTDPQAWLDRVSGSLALVAHTDASYGLERDAGEDDMLILNGVRRSGQAPLLLLQSDESTLRFELVSDPETAEKSVFTKAQHDLWKALPARFTWAQGVAVAGKTRKRILSSLLRRAMENKLLVKSSAGDEPVYEKRP